MKTYELAVAYRIYPNISKQPPVHGQNKLALARLCLASFQRALGGLSTKLYVLLDNCPEPYETLFAEFFDSEDVEFIRFEGEGNAGTFTEQMKILASQEHSESIFFVEDDYFFLPDTIPRMVEFQKINEDAHFISPYDHLDFYTFQLHHGERELRRQQGIHWRTALSNTCTFLTKRTVLAAVWNVFLNYGRLGDLGMFLGVTSNEREVKRLIQRLSRTNEKWLLPTLRRVLGINDEQAFPKDPFRLWYPIPSFATHMDTPFLAPGIEWRDEFKDLEFQLKARPRPSTKPSLDRSDRTVS